MRMTEAASESRRMVDAAAAATPAKVAAARAALSDALGNVSARAKDLVAGVQTSARDQIDQRRALTADRLEGLAEALRPVDQSSRARRKGLAVVGGSGLTLAVLGAGVALGLTISWQLKKRAERREAEAAERARETPQVAPVTEKTAANAGLNL